MKIGRYSCITAVIPAPETPPKINKGGSQHQLEAMKADSNAPKLAKRSPRPDEPTASIGCCCVAHGDLAVVVAQQSAAGVGPGIVSSDMVRPTLLFSIDAGARRPTLLVFVLQFRLESMFGNRRYELFERDQFRIVSDKQQIEILLRFRLSLPLVFHRLDTVKL
jgi:hypothetical protein